MADIITLNCLVQGDTPPNERAFSVEIIRTDTVVKLKKLIKATLAPRFDRIAVNELVLWKVDISLDDSDDKFGVLKTNINVNIKTVLHSETLSALDEIQEHFSNLPSRKHIHIIVERPQLGVFLYLILFVKVMC